MFLFAEARVPVFLIMNTKIVFTLSFLPEQSPVKKRMQK